MLYSRTFVIYPFYIYQFASANPKFLLHPFPLKPSPLGNHMSVLYVCVGRQNLTWNLKLWLPSFRSHLPVGLNPSCRLGTPAFLFGCTAQYAGSQFSSQGSNPCSLQWKRGVLTMGPPRKSQTGSFNKYPCLGSTSGGSALIT